MGHATEEEIAQILQELADQQGEYLQRVSSARMEALCRHGYANLDSLHVERVLRENAKKP